MNTRKLFLWLDLGLIVAIVVSAALLGVMMFQGKAQQKVPGGVPYNVIFISPTQIEVEFGNFSESVAFTDMVIEITSPNGDVSKADVRNSSLDYPQNTPLKSLYSIHISSSGVMEKGTSFMMMNYKNLQIGAWAFKMTHRTTGQQVSGGTIIVPVIDTTPKGSFSELKTISSSEVKLEFGTVSPSTEFTYCYLEAWGPSMAAVRFYMNDTTTMRYQLDDDTILTVVDSNKDGLVNSGDYIVLQCSGRDLADGQWSIETNYIFTEEKIAGAVFNIG